MPAPITLAGFAGSNLAIDARLLPEGVGVDARDLEPGTGDFRPLRERLTVATVPAVPQRMTIWRMGRDAVNDALYWLSWSGAVNVTLGFGSDSTERTYYTGDGGPKWTSNAIALGGAPYPQAARELAVPAPTIPPTVSLTTDGSTGTAAERYYLSTFVNDLGWESAPSPVSTPLACKSGAIVAISNLPAPPAGNYGITLRRIYRTQPDNDNNAEFFFLREIAVGSTSTTDDARALGGVLATPDWIPAPSNAFAIIALWNGMFALCAGRTLHLSSPGAPYAYPVRYDKALKDTPIATAKWGQNLLVLTTGQPVLFEGQEPAGMSERPLPLGHACAAARGVVGFAHGVVWPSNEGLAYAGNTGQALLTQGLLTPEQWRALGPASMVAGRWQRFYVCSWGTVTKQGFMLDPLNPAGGIWWLSSGFDAAHYDELADALFVLEGGNVRKFAAAGAAFLAASFTSKRFEQTHPSNFAVAKVVAASYPLTLQLYGDGVLRETRTVNSARAFKLKTGRAGDWQIKLSGAVRAIAVRLAAAMKDLRGL